MMPSLQMTCDLIYRVLSAERWYFLVACLAQCGVGSSVLGTWTKHLANMVAVFLRSLSLHLQICWQAVPSTRFFYSSLVAGWGIPTLLLALSLALSGVSYRFGAICHINHDNSLGTFWGPLLAFGGLAGILQFTTLGYCIRVYLRSVMNSGSTSATSSNFQSFQGSIKNVGARAAYKRVRKVISLQ